MKRRPQAVTRREDIDPTLTLGLRKKFAADMTRRLNEIRRLNLQFVAKEDVLGLSKPQELPTVLYDPNQPRDDHGRWTNLFPGDGVPRGGSEPVLSAPELTPEEEGAVRDYTSSGYRDTNAVLRGEQGSVYDDHDERVRLLDSAIEKGGEFEEPILVYRGLDIGSRATGKDLLMADTKAEMFAVELKATEQYLKERLPVGSEVSLGGYQSTSPSIFPALSAASQRGGVGVVFEIAAKRGLYIPPNRSQYDDEQEVLLGRFTRYRVKNVLKADFYKDDYFDETIPRIVVQLEQIGDGKADFATLADRPPTFTFRRDADKVEEYVAWLQKQMEQGILEVIPEGRGKGTEPWTNAYVRSAYAKGLAEGRRRLRRAGVKDLPSFDTVPGGMSAVFYRPFHARRLELLYTRLWTDLKGVTNAMSAQMSREMALGMAEGIGPYDMARRLNDRVDKIGITRARLIARTEMVETHNRASLAEYEAAEQVIGEDVLVQWWTALDERVRSSHRARHGVVKKREEWAPLLGEPNCRCSLLPWIESLEEGTTGSTKTVTPVIPDTEDAGPTLEEEFAMARVPDLNRIDERVALVNKRFEQLADDHTKARNEHEEYQRARTAGYDEHQMRHLAAVQRNIDLNVEYSKNPTPELSKLIDESAEESNRTMKEWLEFDKKTPYKGWWGSEWEESLKAKTREALAHPDAQNRTEGSRVQDLLGFEGRPRTETKAKATAATYWLNSVSSDRTWEGVTPFVVRQRASRAHYWDGVVTVSANNGVGTHVHEIGHHLDEKRGLIPKSAAYRNSRRSPGEQPQRLRDILPGHGYRVDEIAYQSDWKDPYSGKIYKDSRGNDYATEVISMGLQQMYDDPIQFYKDDKSYFLFIARILAGDV